MIKKQEGYSDLKDLRILKSDRPTLLGGYSMVEWFIKNLLNFNQKFEFLYLLWNWNGTKEVDEMRIEKWCKWCKCAWLTRVHDLQGYKCLYITL